MKPALLSVDRLSRKAWVEVASPRFTFDVVDSLRDSQRSTVARVAHDTCASVELRLNRGGVRPVALLSGCFVPDDGGRFRVEVGHSGEWPDSVIADTIGLSGDQFAAGLPYDFGEAVVDGLMRFEDETRPSGLLSVRGAAFDEVDSSESVFELAAGLLKLVLLHGAAAKMLSQFLEDLS